MGKFMTRESKPEFPLLLLLVTPETGWDLDKGLMKHKNAKTV